MDKTGHGDMHGDKKMRFKYISVNRPEIRVLIIAIVATTCLGVNAVATTMPLTSCPAPDALLQMANDGDRSAQFVVGRRLLQVSQADVKAGIDWLQRAAEQGSVSAQVLLGTLHLDGKGVPSDPFAAGKWLLMAAEQGNSEAQSRLAVMYTDGIGVPKDSFEALRWKFESASKGEQRRTAIATATSPLSVRAGRASILEYVPYAEQGSSLAQYTLGRMYFDAPYGQRDEKLAVEWLRKAATQGHPRAAIELAEILALGIGVSADDQEALAWYRVGAKQNFTRTTSSILDVSRKYESGRGASFSMEKALFWLLKAAEMDSPVAQKDLGLLFTKGMGVPKDPEQGLHWYQLAANQDNSEAQYALAQMYIEGNGPAPDVNAAYFWWALSARNGRSGGELNAAGYWNQKLPGERKTLDEAVKNWTPIINGSYISDHRLLLTLCGAGV
jgi:TPR repeat protein